MSNIRDHYIISLYQQCLPCIAVEYDRCPTHTVCMMEPTQHPTIDAHLHTKTPQNGTITQNIKLLEYCTVTVMYC